LWKPSLFRQEWSSDDFQRFHCFAKNPEFKRYFVELDAYHQLYNPDFYNAVISWESEGDTTAEDRSKTPPPPPAKRSRRSLFREEEAEEDNGFPSLEMIKRLTGRDLTKKKAAEEKTQKKMMIWSKVPLNWLMMKKK